MWDAEQQAWVKRTISSEEICGDTPRAIRGLAILDRSHLVAAWGGGGFSIVRFDPSGGWAVDPVPPDREGKDEGRVRTDRFTRLIPLSAPDQLLPVTGDLILGICRGGALYVLSRLGEHNYTRVRAKPEEIVPGWRKDWGRLVDGAWMAGHLWLLSSKGILSRYAIGDVRRVANLVPQEEVRIDPPVWNAVFRRVASCEAGLAVLAEESVTFLWLANLQEGGMNLPRNPETWFRVPGAMDCAATLPYPRLEINKENPAWVLVSTNGPGLRWIAWTSNSFPWAAPANFVLAGGGSVLYVAAGRPEPGAPPFVACGTRDQKLVVASILNRWGCEDEIAAQIKVNFLAGASHDQVKEHLLAAGDGIRWWCLLQRLHRDFGSNMGHEVIESLSVEELLRSADTSNLRSLASQIVLCRTESTVPDADARLAEWVLRLLGRANEIGPGVDQEIARLLYEKLQRHEERSQGGEQAGSLAAFLRKWVIYGHTFLEKSTGLLDVFDWNYKCQRSLDALVYSTRLLRQRTDLQWRVSLPPGSLSSTVWSLVTGSGGGFVISSLSDGTLCAVSGEGRRIPWSDTIGEERLKQHELHLTHGGLCLERVDSEAFEKKYYHGPYTRILWLRRVDEGSEQEEHLLVFCPKGWRRQDRPASSHKIYALRLRPLASKVGRIDSLNIVAVDSHETQGEIHSLCEIAPRAGGTPHKVTLVAGTSGSWRSGESYKPRPFIEIEVELDPESISITPVEVKVERIEEGERSVLREGSAVPEAAYNPCWALAPSLVSGGDTIWIWAGFQDGYIRGYQRQIRANGNVEWTEGGGPRASRGAQLTGAVWRLLEFEARGERLLAFGTGDGVIGALRLADLTKKTMGEPVLFPIHTREASPICGLFDFTDWEDEADQHFLMAVTQGGVCCIFSLDFLWDKPKSSSASKDSSLSLAFHYPGLRGERFRLDQSIRTVAWIEGGRVDLDTSTGREGEKVGKRKPPEFLIGTAEGCVQRYQLALPRYSERRRRQAETMQELMLTSRKGLPVVGIVPAGPAADERAWCHRWLRVLHVGESLRAYSVWEELRHAGEELWNEADIVSEAEHVSHFGHFYQAIKRVEPETYGRSPFSKEPAKMLWSEVGRIAGSIARRALHRLPYGKWNYRLARKRLRTYLYLNISSFDLCNRWIGVDQALESTVLIHSFSSFFDWTAVTLIASDQEPITEAEKIREFLVNTLIQRRLNFPDPIVPLETLRTINVAVLRAIVNNCRDVLEPRTFRIVPAIRRDSASESGSSYFAIMAMVGDLWERLARSLPLSDPLVTEILRFFSLSLLLVPDSSLLIGHLVTESRLTEGGIGLAELILEQARSLDTDLEERGWKETYERKVSINEGLRRFQAYIQTQIDFSLAEIEGSDLPSDVHAIPQDQPWRFLAGQAWRVMQEGHREGKFSEESMLVEQDRALRAAAWLSELHRSWGSELELGNWFKDQRTDEKGQLAPELYASLDKYPAPIRWLLSPESVRKFFAHSWIYLRSLALARQDIRYLAQLTSVTSPDGKWIKPGAERTIQEAIDVCDKLLDELQREYLFRPQRDHYEAVIRHWRDQLVKRGGEAITVLDVLDRFNRHVYRTSADNLMDKIVDLAMQIAPISFEEVVSTDEWEQAMDGPLRLLLAKRLSGYPLVRRVFDSGEQLVERTHLAGALLAVARDYVGKPGVLGKQSLASRVVSMKEIRRSMEEAARRMGIAGGKDAPVWLPFPGQRDKMAPGSAAIWDLIAHESAVNIVKHARPGGSRMRAGFQKRRSDGRLFVLVAADSPYVVAEGYKGKEEVAVKKFEADFEEFMELRRRGQIDDHDTKLDRVDDRGAGMGLFMIRRITGMCNIEAKLELFDPEMEVDKLGVLTPIEKILLPLCLCLSWRDEE